jgi:hypothetical protein
MLNVAGVHSAICTLLSMAARSTPYSLRAGNTEVPIVTFEVPTILKC